MREVGVLCNSSVKADTPSRAGRARREGRKEERRAAQQDHGQVIRRTSMRSHYRHAKPLYVERVHRIDLFASHRIAIQYIDTFEYHTFLSYSLHSVKRENTIHCKRKRLEQHRPNIKAFRWPPHFCCTGNDQQAAYGRGYEGVHTHFMRRISRYGKYMTSCLFREGNH